MVDLFNVLIQSQESRFVEILAKLEQSSKRLPEAKESNQIQYQHQDQVQPIVNDFQAQNALKKRESIVAGPWKHNTQNRSECRIGCYCRCHIRQYSTLPWPLNPILGILSFYRCYGRPGVSCNCTRYNSLAIKYRPPPYLWYLCQRHISIDLHRGRLAGPELLLRVPRVLPWAHLYWRYSICNDVKAIQRMFADREASPHDVDPAGRNALLHAAKHESTELAVFLIEQGADDSQPDHLGRAPSERILKRSLGGLYNDHGAIMRLILKGDNFDEFGFTTLHKIVFGFLAKDLWTVLEANPDTINSTDYLGRTPLFWAVLCDHVKHVSLLLAYGANPNARDMRGNTPLDFVRNPVVCQMLFSYSAKMNINPQNYCRSSLHEHILEKGCPDVIDAFASAGLNIDIKDNDDETPLLNAIHAGQTDVVKRLINLGANINSVNTSSRDSALHFAAQYDRTECLKLLLTHGADCSALDWNGRSFAHCAAKSGSAELIRVIVDAKPSTLNLALRDSEGKTPGQWMESRVVRTDCEIGVHEAWEELNHQFVASGKDCQGEGFEEFFRLPGAFPVGDIAIGEPSASMRDGSLAVRRHHG